MRAYFYFIILFLAGNLCWAQSKSYSVKLLNASTQQPVANALVVDGNGRQLTRSNQLGVFTLSLQMGSRFDIVKEGFFIHSLEIDWDQVRTAEPRVLLLTESTFELLEATVSAERIKVTDTTYLEDYAFMGERMLLLSRDYLMVTDTTFLSVKKVKNHKEFSRIEEDVRGYTFLFFEDSVHQVILLNEHLYFYPAFHISQYNSYLKPLEAVWNGIYIMRNCWPQVKPLPVSEYRPGNQGKAITHAPFHNKGVQYLAFEKRQQPREIYISLDTAAIIVAQDAFQDYYGIAAGIEIKFDQLGVFDHPQLFELDVARKTYEKFYASFMPFPIFADTSGLVIFDHIKEKVLVLDENFEVFQSHPFSFGRKVEPPAILRDTASGEYYQLEKHNGLIKLVHLEDFRPGMAYKLDLFAEEVKVQNGRAWFLDEDDKLTFKNVTTSL